MIWIIASIPFWTLGVAFFYGAFACALVRYERETTLDQARQFLTNMLLSGVLLYLAARIAS